MTRNGFRYCKMRAWSAPPKPIYARRSHLTRFRGMFDRHMADVVDAVDAQRERIDGKSAKFVIWAHNTHIGDARATERGAEGYWNLGQLLRERHDGETYLVGFSTRVGTVRAAPYWDQRDRVYTIRHPAANSVPEILGRARLPQFFLVFERNGNGFGALDRYRPHRAIGAVYWPKFERREHYYGGHLARQFDAIVHIDRTHAVPTLP